MIMKYLSSIFVISFIISSPCLHGQEVQWSHELKVGGYERIIATIDNHTIVQRSRREHFEDRDLESELARYNDIGKVTHIIPVDDLEKQDFQEITAINTNLGIAVVYLTTDPRKKQNFLLAAQIYDHTTLAPKEIVDLMTVKYRRPDKPTVGAYRYSGSAIDIDYEFSEDRSKFAIFYSEEQIGKDDYTLIQYAVYDLENGMAEINAGQIETEKDSDKYLIADLAVDSAGNTAILMKEYEDDRGLEFIDRRPSYRYSLYYEPSDSSDYIYDIPMKRYFVDVLMASFDREGNIFLTGMCRKKPANDVYGTVLAKLTPQGELAYLNYDTYSPREVKRIRKKEKDDIQSEYDVIDIKVADDIVYGIYQYTSTRYDRDINNTALRATAFGSSFNNQRFDYREYNYKENVVVHGFTPATGERVWTSVNQRKQSDFNFYEYWSYGNILLDGNNLLLLYNERKKNLKRIDEGKNPNNTDLPDRKTIVNLVKISPSGTSDSKVLSEESYYYLPYEGSYLSDGQLSLIRVRKNFRSFYIGHYKL